MGIGVISDNRIGMLEHFTCGDSVEIQRNDQGYPLSDYFSGLFEQVTLGIQFLFGTHRSMHAEINSVDRPTCKSLANPLKEIL